MTDIYAYLNEKGLHYTRVDHPAVYTCGEAQELVAAMPGLGTKNLFLRDDKGRRHFLLVTTHERQVDFKVLGAVIGVKGLGMASAERLKEYLALEAGSVTLLALINDPERRVELLVDKEVAASESVHCHPLVNTSTLVMPWADVLKFFEHTGHAARVIEVPERKVRIVTGTV